MADVHAELHLVTSLIDGVTDLYVGSETPEEAQIHVKIDADATPPVTVASVRWPSVAQIGIIDNVLGTLGTFHEVRADLRRVIQRMKEANRRPRPDPIHRHRS